MLIIKMIEMVMEQDKYILMGLQWGMDQNVEKPHYLVVLPCVQINSSASPGIQTF